MLWLARLHDELLFDRPGRWWNGVLSAVTVRAHASPAWSSGGRASSRWRRSLKIKWSSGWRRFNWDLHSAVGFWLFLFMLMWGVSGFYLGVPEPFSNFVDSISDPDAYLGERPGDIVLMWLTRLHFGRWREMPWLKAVWAVVGLMPALMFVTGVVMWWQRVMRKRPVRVEVTQLRGSGLMRAWIVPGRLHRSRRRCGWWSGRTPSPGRDRCVVRVRAVSLNYRDQAVVRGQYMGGATTRDLVPVSDGAGDVVSVGAGVTQRRRRRPRGRHLLPADAAGPGRARARRSTACSASSRCSPTDGVVALPDVDRLRGGGLPAVCRRHRVARALRASGRPIVPGDTVLVLGHRRRVDAGAAARARGRRAGRRHVVERRQARARPGARRHRRHQLRPHAAVGRRRSCGSPAAAAPTASSRSAAPERWRARSARSHAAARWRSSASSADRRATRRRIPLMMKARQPARRLRRRSADVRGAAARGGRQPDRARRRSRVRASTEAAAAYAYHASRRVRRQGRIRSPA